MVARQTVKSVVLFGIGELALKAALWFYQHPESYHIKAVVPVTPHKEWIQGSLSEFSKWADVPTSESAAEADLGISIFYDKIFKRSDIAKFKKLINIHASPLPVYRGVAPINWALKNGEHEHGVTIHEITEKVDAGPIISQVKFPLYEFDEVKDAYERMLEYGWMLFKTTMPLLDKITSMPQSEQCATYYSAKDSKRLGEYRYFTKEESLRRI